MGSRGDRPSRSSGPPQFIPPDDGAPAPIGPWSGNRPPSRGRDQGHPNGSHPSSNRPSSRPSSQGPGQGGQGPPEGDNYMPGARPSSRPSSRPPDERQGAPDGGNYVPGARPSSRPRSKQSNGGQGAPEAGNYIPGARPSSRPGSKQSSPGQVHATPPRGGSPQLNMPPAFVPGGGPPQSIPQAPSSGPPTGGVFVPGGGPPPPGVYTAPAPMEPVKAEPSGDHKAAMEQGYAPAAFKAARDSQGAPEEDSDPVLKELNETWPNLVASIVARSPGISMLFMFVVLLVCAVPTFLPAYAPTPLTEFDSLQIKDHPAAAKAFSVLTLENEDTFFKKPEDITPAADVTSDSDDSSRRRRLFDWHTGNSDSGLQFYTIEDRSTVNQMMAEWRGVHSSASSSPGVKHRRLNQDDSEDGEDDGEDGGGDGALPDGLPDDAGNVDLAGTSVFGLGSGEDCVEDTRSLGEERFLVIFYRYENDENAITEEMVAKAREIEDTIKGFPEYQDICQRECDGECQQILSFSTFVHTSKESYLTGEMELLDEPQWDIVQAGEFLVASNFTFFFNIDSNGTTAKWLRSIFPFRQENGLERGKFPYEDGMMQKLIDLFEEENDNEEGIIMNYGEQVINTTQINQQIFRDLRWAALSLFFAACMLRLGSGSTFITLVGIFQIIISFPISWLVYSAPKGWKFVNFIHFLAPFVMLGIGLDDIFVSIAFFQNTRPFMGHFALDTRLTMAFQQASSAMLATSTTSAFAFAANIFSPVPAVQSFGLLLATLVIVNYILAISWLPVCLAVWDKHFEFPKRAAEARGESTTCSCTLCGCCGCGGCFKKQGRVGNMGQTLRIVQGGQEPRALEFMQVVMPFWRTMKETEQIKNHRLLHPDRPPIVISREQLARVHQENAYQLFGRTIDVRKMIGIIFDNVFKYRWLAIGACVLATMVGTAGTIALTPPETSEPPIFDTEHNVQFFYRYINSNESDNVPGCPACLVDSMDSWTRNDESSNDPREFFDISKPLIGFEEGGFSTIIAEMVYGVAEGGIDNGPNTKEGDPAGKPESNRLTFDEAFDPSTVAAQELVQAHLDDLLTYTTAEQRPIFTSVEYSPFDEMREYCAKDTPEQQELFNEEQRGRYCDPGDGVDGLPTGNKFNALAYRLLALNPDITMRNFMGYKRQEDSGESAFDYVECSNQFGGGCNDDFPKVDWVRIRVRTASAKDQSPEDVVQSYKDWNAWSDQVQAEGSTELAQAYKGQFVASKDWVNAVTYTQISDSVYGTVFLSIGLAAAVVFVFCGPLMMLLAAVTVLMINLTVMGVLYLWDWDLGAVEAMSITSLVGLSVDFCIHMSEAFNHAQATWAPDPQTAAQHACASYFGSQPRGREKSKEALILVAIPMVASAVSTVITTTPLFATATLILNRFASVIFVTMLVGLAYVILFLTPMLAMFGPGAHKKKTIDEDTPLHTVVTDTLLNSRGVRFVGVAVIAVLILLAVPSTNERLGSGGALQELMVMLLAVAVVALCVFILSAFIRAAYHKKRHLEDRSRQEQKQFARYQQQMARPSAGPTPTI